MTQKKKKILILRELVSTTKIHLYEEKKSAFATEELDVSTF